MATIKRNSNDRIEHICQKLLNNNRLDETDRYLTLDEFVDLYHRLSKITDSPQDVQIVLLGKNAIVQLPRFGFSRLIVRHTKRLGPTDFSRTVGGAKIFGDKLNYSFWGQVKEEKRNLPILLTVFVLILSLTIWIGFASASNYDNYVVNPSGFPDVDRALNTLRTISDLVVTSATLFLSIFLVFTVAQNVEMIRDRFLFKEGLAHKYHRDDVFITKMALVSLFFGIVNSVILVAPVSLRIATISVGSVMFPVNKLNLFSPLLISLSVTGLATCFLSVLYYFERTILNVGVAMAEKTLDEIQQTQSETTKPTG